ncbi:WD40 repeat domain-containing protein [Fibrella forsythiae]|uniref:WD40 repeat domain-containing protein n=1 Tax=Fibrella forsythiae TaxID=2817061 RepID=A0ABS3JG60_9BACT|nr:WD40 repeat domain-containing protein [Fibrella forsythiae]MBO0948999.1 hypothetical protein [Fibrella forsythiae]
MKFYFCCLSLLSTLAAQSQDKPTHTIAGLMGSKASFLSNQHLFYVDSRGNGISYDLKTKQAIQVISAGQLSIGNRQIIASPDGRKLLVHKQEEPQLIDLDTKTIVRTYRHNSRSASVLAFSHSGNYVAAGFYNGMVYVWQTDSDAPLTRWDAHPKAVSALVFSHDDALMVTGSNSKRICIREGIDGQIQTELSAGGEVDKLSICRDNTHLLSVVSEPFGSQWTSLWNIKTKEELIKLPDVSMAVFSPDGKRFATYNWTTRVVSVWTIANRRIIRAISETCDHLYFSPTGDYLITQNEAAIKAWPMGKLPASEKEITRATAVSLAQWEALGVTYPTDAQVQTKLAEMLAIDSRSMEEWAKLAKRIPAQKALADKKAFDLVGTCSVRNIQLYLSVFPAGQYRSLVAGRLKKATACEAMQAANRSGAASSGYSSSRTVAPGLANHTDCEAYAYITLINEDSMEKEYRLEFYYRNSLQSTRIGKSIVIRNRKDDNRWDVHTGFSDAESSYSGLELLIKDAFNKQIKPLSGCRTWTYLER